MQKKEPEFTVESIKQMKQSLEDRKVLRTWTEFADAIGYDRTYLSRIVNGHHPITPDFETLIKARYSELLDNATSVVNVDQVFYKTRLDDAISDHEERLLRVEAHLEVFESAIAGLLTKDNSEFLNKVGELRSAVQEVVRRRFEELKLKHG